VTERARALRRRQARKAARAFDRLDASESPPEPTVEAIAEHVRCAGSRRFICLEVPRKGRPAGSRITLLSRSGPRSIDASVATDKVDRSIKWDPQRRAVTAYWAVEDLRAWVEYSGGGDVGAGMQVVNVNITGTDIAALVASVYGVEASKVRVFAVPTAAGETRAPEDVSVKASVETGLKGANRADRIIKKAAGK
jgi:hypothetical protein